MRCSWRVWFHRGGCRCDCRDFRVRTLMLGVGVLALLVWGAMMGTRSYHYYRLASFYSFEERAPSPLGGEAAAASWQTSHIISSPLDDALGELGAGLRSRERPSRAPRRVSAQAAVQIAVLSSCLNRG